MQTKKQRVIACEAEILSLLTKHGPIRPKELYQKSTPGLISRPDFMNALNRMKAAGLIYSVNNRCFISESDQPEINWNALFQAERRLTRIYQQQIAVLERKIKLLEKPYETKSDRTDSSIAG